VTTSPAAPSELTQSFHNSVGLLQDFIYCGHTHGSLLAIRAVLMAVIARQLGHADTRMTENHYAAPLICWSFSISMFLWARHGPGSGSVLLCLGKPEAFNAPAHRATIGPGDFDLVAPLHAIGSAQLLMRQIAVASDAVVNDVGA
jgi:hypothetical protein